MRGLRNTAAAVAATAAWITASLAQDPPVPALGEGRPPMSVVRPPAPPLKGPGKFQPAMPLTSPGEWITESDYPAVAVRDGVEGTTGLSVTVGTNGKASNCKVMETSGSAVLDATACALVEERGQFVPALDYDGKRTAAVWSTRVVWSIPDDNVPPFDTALQDQVLSFSFVVGADGTISECRIEKATFTLPPDRLCPKRANLKPALDDEGHPVAKRVTMTMSTVLSDPNAKP